MTRLSLGAVTMVLLFAGAIRAQEKSSAPPPSLSLHQVIASPAVQEALKLDDEQKKTVGNLVTEAREALKGLSKLTTQERREKSREVRDKLRAGLEKALKKEQYERFQQIDLAQRGPIAVTSKEVAQKIGLTKEQRQKVREISRELNETIRKLREDNKGDELREKIAKSRAEAAGKVTDVLTKEQKKTWKEMLGKTFDLSKLERPR